MESSMLKTPSSSTGRASDAKRERRDGRSSRPQAPIVIACLALTACATHREPIVRTVRVEVPIAIACVPSTLDSPPAYPDTAPALRAAPGAAERYQLLAAGRELRIYRLNELEAVVSACR